MVFHVTPWKTEDFFFPVLDLSILTLLDFLWSKQWEVIVAVFNFFNLACLLVTKLVPVSVLKTSDLCSDGLLVSFERVFGLAQTL